MKILTAAEMREIDRITTEKFGVPSLTLMENAGSAVADFCLEQFPEARRVGVICGKGNNGGDGFVAARKLREAGRSVQVLLLADPADVNGDAAAMLQKLPVQPVIARAEEDLKFDASAGVFEDSDLLIDAILGTGFKPPVQGLYAAAIGEFWNVDAPVVSVDVPSGIDADAAGDGAGRVTANDYFKQARSDAIVTFTAPKPALIFQSLTDGPVVVAPIGSPEQAVESALEMEVIASRETGCLRARRAASSHKGDYGHVLVVGGSRGKAGAAAMAGMAALRVGAGLSTIAAPRGVQMLVSSFAPELMTEDLAETESGTISLRALEYGRIDEIAKGKTIIAIGPGVSRNNESAEFVRTLVHRRRVPVVLDADGLNAFEGHDARLEGSGVPLVLTPHPGEMARLTGLSIAEVQRDRVGVARKFAHDHACIVVLKGWRTVVAAPTGPAWVNMTGNPGMATGGTGDILTGIMAGLLAQFPLRQYTPVGIRAVLAAVYLHGRAGDLARDARGEPSLVATDLLEYLPDAFAETWGDGKRTVIRPGARRRSCL